MEVTDRIHIHAGYPLGSICCVHWVRGWVGPTACTNKVEERKYLPFTANLISITRLSSSVSPSLSYPGSSCQHTKKQSLNTYTEQDDLEV